LVDDGIFAAEGLSHLGSFKGLVMMLLRTEGKWQIEILAKPKFGEPRGLVSAEDSGLNIIGRSGPESWASLRVVVVSLGRSGHGFLFVEVDSNRGNSD
jgi:hypothetical protein